MPIAQVSLWMDPFKFSHQEKNERPTVAKLRFCNGVKKLSGCFIGELFRFS